MWRQKKKKDSSLPTSLRREFLFLLIPSLLWFLGISGRPHLLQTHCAQLPESCTRESVLPVDRLSLGMEDETADSYSFAGQNISGVVALTLPHLWTFSQIAAGTLLPGAALTRALVDTLLVFQATAWNGFLTELSHALTQRPRPFVYSDPKIRGLDPSHYTSFYSGHTSFAAVANLTVFFIFLFRGAPWGFLLLSAFSSEVLIFGTGFFRILAGRHFLTDVLAGGIAGALVAWWIVSRFKRQF